PHHQTPRAPTHRSGPARALARRAGRAPGAPLGVTHVGAVRGRSRECGNATPLLIRSANRGGKRWSTRAATAQHAGRSPRRAAGEGRAAARPPGAVAARGSVAGAGRASAATGGGGEGTPGVARTRCPNP